MMAECTVLICLTCGARDDHPTHKCNIAKTCFKCGMKGHINSAGHVKIHCIYIDEEQDCPNRRADRWALNGCERCNSSSHQTSVRHRIRYFLDLNNPVQECPSLWRIYVYVENPEHERILQTRKERKGLHLGQGGEGYIARDACCYNCGGSGHWGDDCREFYHPEPLIEPTAFSYHWLTQGPFTAEHVSESRAPREWVSDVPLPGGVENVGRQAKRKEMEKLARRAKQQQDADEDPADWFQSMGNGKKGERERSTGNIPTGPRKMAGSFAKEHPSFQFAVASSSKTPLVDRLTDRAPDRYRDAKSSNSRDRDSRDRDHREREREKGRHGEYRGPRYKGGYS
ncbi:hypothetical protein B0H12DRAFT_17263 [Mycena haematopus]|nr:hypothetical protein B0H12DRAFT_17263 [Mycena haematopus]